MPNIFSCDPEWFDKLVKETPKAVIATWNKAGGEQTNKWLERLEKLENEGIPVFVCDGDSCKNITDKLGAKESGETIVFQNGKEVGRLAPGQDSESDFNKVKEMTTGGQP